MSIRILLALTCVGLLSCSQPAPREEDRAGDPINEAEKARRQQIQDEIAIGRTMASKLLGTYGTWKKNPLTGRYVNMVGQSMVKQVGRPELSYFFAVLDLDEPNAYATPGGFVFVTRGLLGLLKDESELAAVLAHEIVHINHKHMYLKVAPKREVGAGETLTRILSRGAGDIGSSLSQAVGEGLKTLLESGLTHDNEYDSDTTAVVYSATVGYNPGSLISVLERLKTHKGPSVFEKTHPTFDTRIAKIRATLKENGLKESMKAKPDVLQRRFAVAMKGLSK